jgi:WhiB family redox-sensing transcriptional regulator
MEEGVCAQTDPEAFFPEKGGSTREAKAVCRVCPVREACLNYALDRQERFGIWGGLSERERRQLERRRTCRWCGANPVAADRQQYCGSDCADAARGDQIRRAAS